MYYKGTPKPLTVETIPFNEIADYYGSVYRSDKDSADAKLVEYLSEFAQTHKLKVHAEWILAQLLAKFATLPLEKVESGKYSAKALYSRIRQDNWLSGALLLVRTDVKSAYLRSQTDPKLRNFSSLVPFIMSAFKKMHNISYSEWEPSEIHYITHKVLAETMLLESLPEITKEEVLQDRETALTAPIKGTVNNPATTYRLYIRKESKMFDLPKLAQIMMCQTWCAHPNNRTEYMILDPLNWDHTPEPLVTTEVFKKPIYSKTTTYANDEVW